MLHLAICDDDENALEDLRTKITEVLHEQVLISSHNNPFSLMTYIIDEVKGEIDLVILDIRLKDQDGISVAKTILNYSGNIKIIFITRYLERVKDIFQVNPLYFLTKPVELKYLKDALYKAIDTLEEESTNTLMIRQKSGSKKIHVFKIRDIYYIESDMRLIHVHEASAAKSLYMKLDEIERDLTENFVRCHQSYIVNMDKVMKVSNESVVLFNGANIPISRSKRKDVFDKLDRYFGCHD